jgi:hypothetical protein
MTLRGSELWTDRQDLSKCQRKASSFLVMAEELAKKVCAEVLAGLDPDVLEYISGCVLDSDNLLPKEVK